MSTCAFHKMSFSLKIFIFFSFIYHVKAYYGAFDYELYESVLDPEKCALQLAYLSNDTLGLKFIDASSKLPSGIMSGNLADLGDYFECLSIHEVREDLDIRGKYCMLAVPLDQNPVQVPGVQTLGRLDERKVAAIAGAEVRTVQGARSTAMSLALCLPRVCTVQETMDFFQDRLPILNVTYDEQYCRLPGDKPYVPADYILLVIVIIILGLTIVSTSYDLFSVFVREKEAEVLYSSFSVYTNTRRFLSFHSGPGALECLDGIRSISMFWVVVGHTYTLTAFGYLANGMDVFTWIRSFSSLWVTSAPISVDTFFMLSGILCSYTTIGKVTRRVFIRNIHVFYLNRLLRMFPLLAFMVLVNSSWINHFSDGPGWPIIGAQVESCRKYWWSALLHVQNYANSGEICMGQTWYLSVDIQLYIVSPLVLFWLFGKRAWAWSALVIALLISLVSSTTYSFIYEFPGSFSAGIINSLGDLQTYMKTYYFNTLTRAPPFFVGLLYGYLLHLFKNKKVVILWYQNLALWVISLLLMALAIFPIYSMSQPDYDNQLFNNFFNAYVRAIWAGALGWVIFACVHGYGGPVNWLLSLPMWKLPARLSYAIYLIHYMVMMVANGSWVHSHRFTTYETFYRFMSDLTVTIIASLVLCIILDAPCSTLQKMLLMPGGSKKRTEKSAPEKPAVGNDSSDTTLQQDKI